jgi:hypothetical protein
VIGVAVIERASHEVRGLTPEELAARVDSRYAVSAYGLSMWMRNEGLAEMREGRLVATPAGVELGELLSRS